MFFSNFILYFGQTISLLRDYQKKSKFNILLKNESGIKKVGNLPQKYDYNEPYNDVNKQCVIFDKSKCELCDKSSYLSDQISERSKNWKV